MSKPLIAISNEGYAHLLANYLTSQSLPARVQPHPDNDDYVVILQNPSDVERALPICEAFLKHPGDPKYQQAAWESGEHVALHPGKPSNLSIANLVGWARTAPFTAAILFICTAVFVLSYLGLFSVLGSYLRMLPLSAVVSSHEYWRLITPAFLHFSAVHFIFNVLWWSMIGAQIERVLGLSMILLVFVVSAITSNVAQVLVSGPAFGGLSGVVYAVLGFVWWLGWLKPAWGLSIPRPVIGFMLVWLVLGYTDILWVNMANTAHTVGLISGCALAALLALGDNRRKQA